MEGYPTLSEPELRRLLSEATKPAEGVQTLLSSHTTQLAAHDLRLDGHDAVLATHNARIGSVETSSSNHSGRIAALEEDSTSYGQRLTAAEQSIQAQLTDIQALQSNQPAIIVRNEVQFAAALSGNKRIVVDGNVMIAGQYTLDRPLHMSCLPGSKLIFQHPGYWWDLKAPLTLVDFYVEGVSPNQGYFLNVGGMARMGVDSCLRIVRGGFKNMGSVLVMTGGPGAPLGPRMWLRDVEIENIGSPTYDSLGKEGAISLAWHLGMTVLEDLRIKNTHGNALYFAESGQPGVHAIGEPGTVKGCTVHNYRRNGIETFTAARFNIEGNRLYGGSGDSYDGGGIGISMAGDLSTSFGNLVDHGYTYAMECYGKGCLVQGNIIDTLTADIGLARACVGLSVDTSQDCLIIGNIFKNITHGLYPRYSIAMVRGLRNALLSNIFRNCSFGCWLSTENQGNTFKDNDLNIDFDPSVTDTGLARRAYLSYTDNDQIVINNTARVGPNLAPLMNPALRQQMFSWNNGCGGHYDYTSGYVAAGPSGTDFGNASMNLVI